MSNQMLNASASPHGDLDAIFEQDYGEREDAETLTL